MNNKERCQIGFEVQGNNGGNYIKLGKFKDGDNRLFIEVGDCCVITFRGIITVEAFTNFLTNVTLDANKPLHMVFREKMTWDEDVNERLFDGSKELEWYETPM